MQMELAVGATGFLERPRMTVDADDLGPRPAFGRPRRPRCAGAAAEVHQRAGTVRGAGQRADDFPDQQKVEGTIEEREGGSFPGACERGALSQLVPAFDVGG